MKQEYFVGEVAILHDKKRDWLVKVTDCGQDDKGDWYYDVVPAEFLSITRTVAQGMLEKYNDTDDYTGYSVGLDGTYDEHTNR